MNVSKDVTGELYKQLPNFPTIGQCMDFVWLNYRELPVHFLFNGVVISLEYAIPVAGLADQGAAHLLAIAKGGKA